MLRGLRSSVAVCVLLAFCFAAPASAARLARWTQLTKLDQVVDLSPQLPSGAIIVDETAGLASMHPGRKPVPYAPAYVNPGGDEPYMAVAPAGRRGRCSFGAGWEALLFNGVLGAAGAVMVLPLFVPSRWRATRSSA